ncbi:hypothetical protein SCLCIDRAFT_23407 [Scleroderma citrinum Foug A]|uniref:Fungal-type protein kinase domain-containing protein n=1 Tax=Scleroderma citrinum Foug A TaxID=1036808 RepID=A0A0C3E8Q8_9AGAM|nr:hypothetical protein SCLCIDRAFT_23407 [Scleroderma citrinum Foug A]
MPCWSQKPDLILLEGSQDGDPVTWKCPRAISEFMHSRLAVNMTLIKTLNTKAYLLLSSQPWHRYVLALSFANFQMRIYFYDHSGVQISPPLNFHCDFQAVVGIIHMFTHANRELLGFDLTIDVNHGVPSIPKQPGPIFNFISTVQGAGSQIYCIFELLWASAGFIRRGTVSYHVRPEVTGPSKASEGLLDDYDYILKDNWVNQAQVDHEPNILKHIAGIEGVPVLVDLWAVQFEEKEDMMLRYRPAGWIPPTLFVNHVHRRQLMHPVGSPITSFQSQKELLFGLIHRLETHEHLVTLKHVLHCDVSPNNLVFKQAPPGTLHTLYLIDFDYAIRLQPIDGEVTNYPKGTGTLPFALLQMIWSLSFMSSCGSAYSMMAEKECFIPHRMRRPKGKEPKNQLHK